MENKNVKDFKIGDMVILVDDGDSFTTYSSFFAENGREELLKEYDYNCTPPKYSTMRVEFIGTHAYDKRLILGLRLVGTDKIYLVAAKGVVSLNVNEISKIWATKEKLQLLQTLLSNYSIRIGDVFDVVAIPEYNVNEMIEQCKELLEGHIDEIR